MTATANYGERVTSPGVQKAGAIVVAYPGDRSGMAALQYAVIEARLRNTQLQVVHQLVGADRPDRLSTVREFLDQRDRVASRIRSVVEAAAPDLSDVYVVVTTDRIADEIVVASRRAALVVIGSTARHEVTAALFEENAHAVARDAHCPVVLIPDNQQDTDPRILVCGVDRTPESLAALHWAATDAGLRGVNVLAIEVGPRPSLKAPGRRPLLSSWVGDHVPAAPTTIVCRAEFGNAAKSLIAEASSRPAMLVLGRHEDRRGWFSRSVLAAATAQNRVPVVVVPMTAQAGHSSHG